MGLLNVDNISLMAFSTEDVIAQWRAEVESNERNKTQVVEITEHENTHTDTYGRTDHTDYTRLATGMAEGAFGVNDELARATVYVPRQLARASVHTDTYSQRNTYSNTAHRDVYSQVAHTDYTKRRRYTQVKRRNRYTKAEARDTYSKADTHTDYTRYEDSYTKTAAGYSQRNAYRDGTYTQYARAGYDQYGDSSYSEYGDNTYEEARYNRYDRADYRQEAVAGYIQYARADYRQYPNSAYSENVYQADDTRDGLVDYYQGSRYIKTNEYTEYRDTEGTYTKIEDSYSEAGVVYSKTTTGEDIARYYEQTYDPVTRYAEDYAKWATTEDGYYNTRRDEYQGTGGTTESTEGEGAYNAFIENEDGTYTYGKYSGYYTGGTAYTEYVPAYRQYSRATYTYTRIAARDEYTRTGYDKGFDHTNYVPSAPEVYDLEGNVISGTLDIYLASYDANNDGLGSQDQESKDIYYTVKIRQTHDLTGAEINGEWVVLQEGATTADLNVDVSKYPDGIYELSTQSYNMAKSEKDVTKTYVSEEKISTFTISSGGLGSTSTVLNADEFNEFIYGIETYANSKGTIKKYVDSILYDDPRLEEIGGSQKGLFLVTELTDEDTDTYHKTLVSLEKDGVIIAKDYEIVYETDADGTPKPGNKEGVVFIPLEDMLDDGSFNDVKIMLTTTEYTDSDMTEQKGSKEKVQLVTDTGAAVLVDLDANNPTILISEPTEATVINVDVAVSDIGSGVLGGSTYYQVTKKGEPVSENGWEQSENNIFSILLNETGEYDIYVKVQDKAGNETMGGKAGYVVRAEGVTLNVPAQAKPGDTVKVTATIKSDKPITGGKVWIDGYGEPVTATNNGDGTWTAEITIPENVPFGQHDIYFEATRDGDTLTGTGAIMVSDEKIVITAPSTATPDSKIEVTAEVESVKEVVGVTTWLETEYGALVGEKIQGTKVDGKWVADLVVDEDLEPGIYVIVTEVEYSDGTTVKQTKTILVVNGDLTDDGTGIRFISKDYIYTLNEDGQWTKAELEEIFDNDEPLYDDEI